MLAGGEIGHDREEVCPRRGRGTARDGPRQTCRRSAGPAATSAIATPNFIGAPAFSPVIAIMRPDHPLARHASVTLAQMHPYPVALPERDNTVRQLFDIGCSQRQLVFDPVLVSNHFETLTHFVLHAGGMSISGEVTVRERVRRGELHAALIRERSMNGRAIELQTLAGRTLPEGVRAFIAHLRQQLPPPPDRQCGAMDPPACRQAEPHTVLTR